MEREYNVVVLNTGWQNQINPENLPMPKIAHDACLYILCETTDLFDAFSVAKCFDFSPKTSQVFRLFQRSRPVRQGPQKTVSSTHQVLLCFIRGECHFYRPVGQQMIEGNLNVLLDEISDHTVFDERVLLTYDQKARSSSEFDTIVVENDANDTKFIDRRRFDPSTARGPRRLKAYLSKVDLKTLRSDKRTLQNYFNKKPYDETRKIMSYLPLESEKNAVMAMVNKTLKRKQNKDPEKKPNRNTARSGIAKKTLISDALKEFLIKECGLEVADDGIPRTEVVRALPKYIKKEQLNEGRTINVNESLKALFQPDFDFSQEITFFNIYRFINHNFFKKNESEIEQKKREPSPSPSPLKNQQTTTKKRKRERDTTAAAAKSRKKNDG